MTTKEKMKSMRGKRNSKNMKARSERKTSYGENIDPLWKESILMIKASEIKDELIFRILPPAFESEDGHWAFTAYIHYKVGVNEKAFICPKKMHGKSCPICEEITTIEDPDIRKLLYPVYGALTYVIDRQNEDDGVKLFRIPFTVEQDILTQASRADILTIDDENEGFDITISYTKEKNQDWGKWGSVSIARRETPLSDDDDKIDEWLEFVNENSPDKIINVHSYEKIAAAFNGTEEIKKESTDAVEDSIKEETKTEKVKNKMKSFRKL